MRTPDKRIDEDQDRVKAPDVDSSGLSVGICMNVLTGKYHLREMIAR